MENKKTIIELQDRESALVFKPDGQLQMYLNCDTEKTEKLAMNEILAVALATLLKNNEFTTKTINLFLELKDKLAIETIKNANQDSGENND